MNTICKLVMGYEQHGHTVQLLAQAGGFYEIRAQQRGFPPRSKGVYPKEQLIEAMNVYHQVRDAMCLVAKAA